MITWFSEGTEGESVVATEYKGGRGLWKIRYQLTANERKGEYDKNLTEP